MCADNHAIQQGVRIAFDLIAIHSAQCADFGRDCDRHPESFWRGTHPRGLRWATHVDGVTNDDSVVDQGWTVEIAFPWPRMKWLANGRSLPPKYGDKWRVFLGHRPARFARVHFSEEELIL